MTEITHKFEDGDGNHYCFIYNEQYESIEIRSGSQSITLLEAGEVLSEVKKFYKKVNAIWDID